MTPLILLAIQQAPHIIETLQFLFHQRHPGEPIPSELEIIAACQQGFLHTIAKDAAWLAAHPTRPA